MSKNLIDNIHKKCMGIYHTEEARQLANTIINEIEASTQKIRIFVEIENGSLQSIFGDDAKSEYPISFILRDMDSINMNECDDPVPTNYTPTTIYW